MIQTKGKLEILALRFSFILDKTTKNEPLIFPTTNGRSEEAIVKFLSVETFEGNSFEITGEISEDGNDLPIIFLGIVLPLMHTVKVDYEIERRLDAGDEDENAGEDWKKLL